VTPTPQSTATTTNARTRRLTLKGTALRARSYFDYNGALQSAEHERTLNHLTTLPKEFSTANLPYFRKHTETPILWRLHWLFGV